MEIDREWNTSGEDINLIQLTALPKSNLPIPGEAVSDLVNV